MDVKDYERLVLYTEGIIIALAALALFSVIRMIARRFRKRPPDAS